MSLPSERLVSKSCSFVSETSRLYRSIKRNCGHGVSGGYRNSVLLWATRRADTARENEILWTGWSADFRIQLFDERHVACIRYQLIKRKPMRWWAVIPIVMWFLRPIQRILLLAKTQLTNRKSDHVCARQFVTNVILSSMGKLMLRRNKWIVL